MNGPTDLQTAIRFGEVKPILTSIVGSRAHGTAGPDSDEDVRTVFLQPTSSLLSIGQRDPSRTLSLPGRDHNAWELGHFLDLCRKGNPSTLEVLLVEPRFASDEGERLRSLFPRLVGRQPVYNAFNGFATSERKTFLSPNSGRTFKSMGHYLRILYNGIELLSKGTMTVRIVDTEIGALVLAAKAGRLTAEEVLSRGEELSAELRRVSEESVLPESAALSVVNEFLLEVRYNNLTF